MYHSTPPAPSCGQDSSGTVQDLARRLRLEAEAVEAVRERLRGAQEINWESPAGRNFRSFVAERAAVVSVTAAHLREAAFALDAYGVALAAAQGEGVPG